MHDYITIFCHYCLTTEFMPLPGAVGFQVSNPPVFETVALLSSLKVTNYTTEIQNITINVHL